MTTLTTQFGIKWDVGSYGDRASFNYAPLDINVTYHPSVGEYVAWYMGVEVLSCKKPGVCLEAISEVILDYYASLFTPMWDETGLLEHIASEIKPSWADVVDQAAE